MLVDEHIAKAQLSRLIDAALAGEEVIITCDGIPTVRLVPIAKQGDRTDETSQAALATDPEPPVHPGGFRPFKRRDGTVVSNEDIEWLRDIEGI